MANSHIRRRSTCSAAVRRGATRSASSRRAGRRRRPGARPGARSRPDRSADALRSAAGRPRARRAHDEPPLHDLRRPRPHGQGSPSGSARRRSLSCSALDGEGLDLFRLAPGRPPWWGTRLTARSRSMVAKSSRAGHRPPPRRQRLVGRVHRGAGCTDAVPDLEHGPEETVWVCGGRGMDDAPLRWRESGPRWRPRRGRPSPGRRARPGRSVSSREAPSVDASALAMESDELLVEVGTSRNRRRRCGSSGRRARASMAFLVDQPAASRRVRRRPGVHQVSPREAQSTPPVEFRRDRAASQGCRPHGAPAAPPWGTPAATRSDSASGWRHNPPRRSCSRYSNGPSTSSSAPWASSRAAR